MSVAFKDISRIFDQSKFNTLRRSCTLFNLKRSSSEEFNLMEHKDDEYYKSFRNTSRSHLSSELPYTIKGIYIYYML